MALLLLPVGLVVAVTVEATSILVKRVITLFRLGFSATVFFIALLALTTILSATVLISTASLVARVSLITLQYCGS